MSHSDRVALRAAKIWSRGPFGLPLLGLACAGMLAACSTTEPQLAVAPKPATKEYFAEAEYGVKASPRVTEARSRLPRGGGRDQVGKPYKVKGKWYTPSEDPDYRKSGMASWYGDAFHGRLTANGEIYDMTHLTAAHPTMPLPSYARVTNATNGHSVIVRVNDRGPFAHGRIIDLSRRAAELLDYTHSGVAKVQVEYVGRAPLDGRDDEFLMASYRPGSQAPDPSDGLPAGVMIAMNGPTPTTPVAAAFPVTPVAPAAAGILSTAPVLPDLGPIVPERPGVGLASRIGTAAPAAASAYADSRVRQAASVAAVNALVRDEDGLVAALEASTEAATAPYVAVGTYADRAGAESVARALGDAGVASIETDAGDGYTLVLRSANGADIDDLLRAAWAAGASDAVVVRR
jgi:rare lipoprotein A